MPDNTARHLPVKTIRLGVRCLCIRSGRLLLMRHFSTETGQEFWAMPGGLVEKGETLVEAAQRELTEETGLVGRPRGIVAIHEFTDAAIIEVVFAFTSLRGKARLGTDPEQTDDQPLRLRELRWFRHEQLPPVKPEKLIREILEKKRKPELLELPYSITCD